MPLLDRPHKYCAKFVTVRCNPKHVWAHPIVCFIKKKTPNKLGKRNKMVRNLFPNGQFGNGMFSFTDRNSEEKTVLNHQLGNNIFHSQMGIRNKTVLNFQLWTKCSIYRWELKTKQFVIRSQMTILGTSVPFKIRILNPKRS